MGTIIERIVEERLSPGRLEGLQIIGVDELGWRAGHKYVSLVVDHLRSRVVWVGEGKNEETLNAFFDELGEERTKECPASITFSPWRQLHFPIGLKS